MNRRKCEICKVDVHGTTYAKHLRSKKYSEKKLNEMIIPEWLFKEPIESKIKKLLNPKPLKQTTRDTIEIDDKQLNKELAKKMIIPYYFTDRAIQVGFNITLESHHINHANSKIKSKPNYTEFGTELRYINKK